jgi:hypothetical protein
MSRRWLLLISLPVILALVAAAALWFARPKMTAVTIEVSGTPGLALKGTAEVDGRSQELTGAVPARFVLEGCRVTYSLATTQDSGEFRVKALIGGAAINSATSGTPPRNGVRGWVKSGWAWSSPSHWIESFDRDGGERWLAPPP